jgi:hypothetical protein
MLTRRSLLSGGASAAALALLPGKVSAYADQPCWLPPTSEKPTRPDKAASLNRLLSDAMLGGQPRLGMTRIDGFVLDNGDAVIYGRKDPKRAELAFDDLVVAIRAVNGVYGRGFPAISLDWAAGASEKMHQAHSIRYNKGDKAGYEYKVKVLKEVCHDYTGWARIRNLPPDSPLTKGLIEGDWAMKEVSTGHKKLKIKDPFPTVADLEFNETKRRPMTEIEWDRRPRAPMSQIGGRFWFESGKVSYVEDGSTTFLDLVQVVLRDVPVRRREHREGDDPDTEAKVDAPEELENSTWLQHVRAYTCSFTNRMDDIVRSGEPWQGLNDAFRLVALARVISKKGKSLTSIDRKLLLRTYEPARINIPSHFPHDMFIEKKDIRFKDGTKTRIFMNCGGVILSGMPILSTASQSTRSDMRLAGRMALDSMRSCAASCWDVL